MPHGSWREDSASARPHRLWSQEDGAPPRPALCPPLGGATRSSLRRPHQPAGLARRHPGVKGVPGGGLGSFSQAAPAAPVIECVAGSPTRQSPVPSFPVTQLFPPLSSSNFPFSFPDPSELLLALPPTKAGAESPLPAAPLLGHVREWGTIASAAGFNIPIWNPEPARPVLRDFGGKPTK